jgi:hypothetical protein
MAHLRLALFTVMLAPHLALAQPAPSPSPQSREVIDSFIDAFVTPTHMTGRIARWEKPLCAVTVG